ncbi:MAG: hypothetical protein COT84_05885, partial [Chlamydiae bacterium CG10_big_fil_rev_8_21_14_0_10_35_9]
VFLAAFLLVVFFAGFLVAAFLLVVFLVDLRAAVLAVDFLFLFNIFSSSLFIPTKKDFTFRV